jgi:hypothetical protein
MIKRPLKGITRREDTKMSSVTIAAPPQPPEPRGELTSAVKAGFVNSIEDGSPRIMEASPRPIVLQVENTHAENADSKTWQLLTLIVPVLLTGWLTFVSSRSESTIRRDIEDQNQVLSAQLDLTKDLYKRRFDTYEKLYTQLIVLNDKLAPQFQEDATNNGRLNRTAALHLALWKSQVADFLRQLDDLNKMNGLHMSPDVEKLMGEAWQLGVRGNMQEVRPKIQAVEIQMKSELDKQMLREQETLLKVGTQREPEKIPKPESRKAGAE